MNKLRKCLKEIERAMDRPILAAKAIRESLTEMEKARDNFNSFTDQEKIKIKEFIDTDNAINRIDQVKQLITTFENWGWI